MYDSLFGDGKRVGCVFGCKIPFAFENANICTRGRFLASVSFPIDPVSLWVSLWLERNVLM